MLVSLSLLVVLPMGGGREFEGDLAFSGSRGFEAGVVVVVEEQVPRCFKEES